jgi:hypothetical protein
MNMAFFNRKSKMVEVDETIYERPRAIDLDALEHTLKLEEELQSKTMQARLALPSYVEHMTSTDSLGKLSSEAVVQQYENAARGLEALGRDLIKCAVDAEAMAAQVKDAIEYVNETAKHYREEARVIFYRIEEASAMAAMVKRTCIDLQQKIVKSQPVVAAAQTEQQVVAQPAIDDAAAVDWDKMAEERLEQRPRERLEKRPREREGE